VLDGTIKLEVTPVFERNFCSTARVVINRGGTRSSKTYSLAQLFIVELFSGENKILSVVRKSFPALRATALRDVIEVLHKSGLYALVQHNKTENIIKYGSNILEFFSLDNEQKVRGRKRTHLWLNEANECTFDEWQQLIFRTSARAYLDFNPDDINCWINTELEQTRTAAQGDVEVIISTYRDNTFLDRTTIAEIEYLRQTDPEYWKIFGMGEYGRINGLVFEKYSIVPQIPSEAKLIGYGLDFGFSNDPTAMVEVRMAEGNLYINEHIYETGLTNTDIISRLNTMPLQRFDEIIADAAEPKSIEEIYRAGYNIKPAQKGPDSINLSIDLLRRYQLCVTASSLNVIKELRSYKWQTDKNGTTINKPVDYYNHALDALRYVVLNKLQKPRNGNYAIR
jgi:phage terminase large subunit